MAFSICKEYQFAAAHQIPDHPGKCQYLHGHNYRVRVFLHAEQLDALGMVIDFADLKKILEDVAGRYDHRVINEIPPFDEINPTAELLSEHLFRGVEGHLAAAEETAERVFVRRVEVWENSVSCAIYEP